MRMACIYAALDGCHQVRIEHLKAGLAVWRYCEDSARYIFGDALGDSVADAILDALRATGEQGLTRWEIYEQLGHHRSRERIGLALSVLADAGLATVTKEETGGRPAERWRAS